MDFQSNSYSIHATRSPTSSTTPSHPPNHESFLLLYSFLSLASHLCQLSNDDIAIQSIPWLKSCQNHRCVSISPSSSSCLLVPWLNLLRICILRKDRAGFVNELLRIWARNREKRSGGQIQSQVLPKVERPMNEFHALVTVPLLCLMKMCTRSSCLA